MIVARTAAEVLAEDTTFTTLELKRLGLLYLNVYVPLLQDRRGVSWFFRRVRDQPVPSSALMVPIWRRFVAWLEALAADTGRIVRFARRKRKDEVTKARLWEWRDGEGEGAVRPARTLRTEWRRENGETYPWIVESTAMAGRGCRIRSSRATVPSARPLRPLDPAGGVRPDAGSRPSGAGQGLL